MAFRDRIVRLLGGSDCKLELRYFDDVLREELEAVNARRRTLKRLDEVAVPTAASTEADPANPDRKRMRPQPNPCDATGLALSGGGIRSAATCLKALQALDRHDRIAAIDYLSTVSGGGYIGACLTAQMRRTGTFPFGNDVRDNSVVGHLRNYSNYLMPRGRSALRNGAEAAAVILRGILANTVIVATFLLIAALLTRLAYGDPGDLSRGSPVVRFVFGAIGLLHTVPLPEGLATPFLETWVAAAVLGLLLVAWAIMRSLSPLTTAGRDTGGRFIVCARWALGATILLAVIDLQPLLIEGVLRIAAHPSAAWATAGIDAKWAWGALATASAAVATFTDRIGHFLKATERASGLSVIAVRLATKAVVLAAACILPLSIWAAYLVVAAGLIGPHGVEPADPAFASPLLPSLRWLGDWRWCLWLWLAGTAVSSLFGANGYSLHSFYRNRLARAFLFPLRPGDEDPPTPPRVKLSELRGCRGPYPILNAALNVQGSAEANRRGRDADFFVFTPHFVGSDLTFYAHTAPAEKGRTGVEALDPVLDLAAAMATSGAAISANMGTGTVRALSPTLALLNIRLGYWLRNPRNFRDPGRRTIFGARLKRSFLGKFYLFAEMFNFLDETQDDVLLTDGGHIENLGLYELLKRGCRMIVVVDAEADPDLSFPSLLRLERYARIDFGIRIELPWQAIASAARDASEKLARGESVETRGPHCAVGRITYADGTTGTLLYFKSSITGDEKDYVLDYKRRNPDFPQEATGDQFFSEEQFEMYRALGFHMVDGFFDGRYDFPFLPDTPDAAAVRAAIDTALPRGATKPSAPVATSTPPPSAAG